MSTKNLFFLKKGANISGISALNNFDPIVKIIKLNGVIMPEEINNFDA